MYLRLYMIQKGENKVIYNEYTKIGTVPERLV